MKLSFYGADQCVTGSCHCLEINDTRILIDCGLQQGRDEVSNGEFPFAANTIDYVLVTHAHIDHSGRIPMLIKQGFKGRILTTRLTAGRRVEKPQGRALRRPPDRAPLHRGGRGTGQGLHGCLRVR